MVPLVHDKTNQLDTNLLMVDNYHYISNMNGKIYHISEWEKGESSNFSGTVENATIIVAERSKLYCNTDLQIVTEDQINCKGSEMHYNSNLQLDLEVSNNNQRLKDLKDQNFTKFNGDRGESTSAKTQRLRFSVIKDWKPH